MARRTEPGWAVRIAFFAVPLAAVVVLGWLRDPPPPSRHVVATFGGRTYELVVAGTEAEQQRGLQGIPRPEVGEGMLFPIDPPRTVTMLIKRLPYPVDVAFVADDGRVVRTVSIQPTPLGIQAAPSDVPVRWVVETRAGSLAAGSIPVGSVFGILREAR